MKTKEQLTEYIRLRPGITNHTIKTNLHRHGITDEAIAVARSSLEGGGCSKPNCPCAVQAPKKRSISSFIAEHDIAHKIRQGLKKLGRDGYMLDNEFREFCGVHVNQWRRYAELDEFSPSRMKHCGQQHWAAPETIEQMKGIVGLA
jgi:hypothetical protein